jgi:SAM-dependent methyltransferase
MLLPQSETSAGCAEGSKYVPHLAAAYDRGAAQYRSDDEIEVQTRNHERLGQTLRRLCLASSRPVRVLEIGCGTGRYFHWLTNVSLLVGTDISPEMLKLAEHPVREGEITAREIRLLHGNIYEMDFAPGSFDLIYSLGVFGYGAVWTQALSDQVYRWLAPAGRLFFDAIEVPHAPTRLHRVRESVKSQLYRALPAALEKRMRARDKVPTVRHSRGQVQRIIAASGFAHISIASYRCDSPLWNGVHLECTATKPSAPEA